MGKERGFGYEKRKGVIGRDSEQAFKRNSTKIFELSKLVKSRTGKTVKELKIPLGLHKNPYSSHKIIEAFKELHDSGIVDLRMEGEFVRFWVAKLPNNLKKELRNRTNLIRNSDKKTYDQKVYKALNGGISKPFYEMYILLMAAYHPQFPTIDLGLNEPLFKPKEFKDVPMWKKLASTNLSAAMALAVTSKKLTVHDIQTQATTTRWVDGKSKITRLLPK